MWRIGKGTHTPWSGSWSPRLTTHPEPQVLGSGSHAGSLQSPGSGPGRQGQSEPTIGTLLGWSPNEAPLLGLSIRWSAHLSPAQSLLGTMFKCGRPALTPPPQPSCDPSVCISHGLSLGFQGTGRLRTTDLVPPCCPLRQNVSFGFRHVVAS